MNGSLPQGVNGPSLQDEASPQAAAAQPAAANAAAAAQAGPALPAGEVAPAEQKPAEQKSAEQKPAEQKPAQGAGRDVAERMLTVARVGILIVLAVMCSIICVAAFEGSAPFAWTAYASIPAAAVLVLSAGCKLLPLPYARRIGWFVADSVFLVAFGFFSGVSYIYVVYALVLSDFYLSSPSLRHSVIYFGVNFGVYTAWYIVVSVINKTLASAFMISSQYFVALIVLALHFAMFNFSMTVWRKNRQIEQNMADLEESRNELLRAYDKLEEATLLEERNRIAKEIHDTAGHSLTTVIMQTEAARLAVDKDKEEARRCIAAANIQAKNCLEELRLSVHLLSGKRENVTFKEYLENILEETSAGTYLTVRSKIDDMELSGEAERFIANTLREGLSNGIRHGGGTAFLFELEDKGNYIEFLLSDNGKGVDWKTFKEGFGLSGMRVKAESMGGMVHYSSEEGEGFEIRLSLPASVKKARGAGEGAFRSPAAEEQAARGAGQGGSVQ